MDTATINDARLKSEKKMIESPCITLILPVVYRNDELHLKAIKHNVEHELKEQSGNNAKPILEKLENSINKINLHSNKKTFILFLSSEYEKVYYLDTLLDERIVINVPFEIRNLVGLMQPVHKFLLLLQSANNFKVFLGDKDNLIKLPSGIPDNINAYRNDIAEKIENFSDITDRKEIMLDKFIHHIDKELEMIRHRYPLPVFVIGPERMNGHFKKLSHNEKVVLEYIHGNYDEAKPYQLLQLVHPYLADLEETETLELKKKIELALNDFKFSTGIEDVWSNVLHKRGNLLLVDSNFTYPHNSNDESGNLNSNVKDIHPEFVKDAVGIIMEQVLESGGHVQYVDGGPLNDYGQIALFQYY
jgi:hypothetical protein